MPETRQLEIDTSQGYAGRLTRESQFVFNYRTSDAACEIALSMPLRAKSYAANTLPGVLRQNLPEGYLYFWLKEHFGKAARMDDMDILALSGRQAIGRVHCRDEARMEAWTATPGENLKEILTWQGTEDLFGYLIERYALVSGISGVQPKVMLRGKPEEGAEPKDVIDKATLKTRGLIIKSAGNDYPGLAENEFICMSIARTAGLEVPDFWLSDDKKLFVVQRFDDVGGQYLGFEDMTSLMDKQTDEKYTGSYEAIARAVTLFCSPGRVAESLKSLFEAVALSVLLRNGDAHLKNFGLLYTHPRSDDCRLSPLYDVVNTTAYIPKDTLALKLGKSKAWPTRETLLRFGGECCRLDRSGEILDALIESASSFRPDENSRIWEKMRPEMERACAWLSA
jgi:serine/threonine-protein kinase HipA